MGQKITKHFFDGVYARDTLEDIQSQPILIICNTAASTEEGEHWVAFYFEGDEVEFFDSLGHPIDFYGEEFVTFVRRFAKRYTCVSVRLQPLNTSLCGVYCLFYSFWRCQGFHLKTIVKHMKRAYKVCKFVKTVFKVCPCLPCPLLQTCTLL
jgi:hypothetical protein